MLMYRQLFQEGSSKIHQMQKLQKSRAFTEWERVVQETIRYLQVLNLNYDPLN